MTNIEKLARLIVSTGNADQIMNALTIILTPNTTETDKQKEVSA